MTAATIRTESTDALRAREIWLTCKLATSESPAPIREWLKEREAVRAEIDLRGFLGTLNHTNHPGPAGPSLEP